MWTHRDDPWTIHGVKSDVDMPFVSAVLDSLASIIQVLVLTSRFEHCSAYVRLPLEIVQKLQLVQDTAAKLMTGTRSWNYIMPVLEQFN